MYILCGYYQTLNTAQVKIFGIFETLEDAKMNQLNKFGRIGRWNNCWEGKNGIVTWIYQADYGIFEKALDIKDTQEALLIED